MAPYKILPVILVKRNIRAQYASWFDKFYRLLLDEKLHTVLGSYSASGVFKFNIESASNEADSLTIYAYLLDWVDDDLALAISRGTAKISLKAY